MNVRLQKNALTGRGEKGRLSALKNPKDLIWEEK